MVVVTLLRDILPRFRPALFPDFEGMRWVQRQEYELTTVLGHRESKKAVKEEMEEKLRELDRQIEQARETDGFLHGILTKSDDALVQDVKRCLQEIGFQRVVDVDAELEDSDRKQEDLRIEDGARVIVVEVKGLAGLPREDDAMQVVKYIGRRVRELDRTDVRGLVIVNHQRQLPPLERDNENAFTSEQIGDACNNSYTVATTWDIFRLLRGMRRWGWSPQHVQNRFEADGRMSPLPTHYQRVGTVAKYWPKVSVVSVDLTEGPISVGERVAYVASAEFLEEEITSVEIDGKSVSSASGSQRVGIKTNYPKEELPVGTQVCRVCSTSS